MGVLNFQNAYGSKVAYWAYIAAKRPRSARPLFFEGDCGARAVKDCNLYIRDKMFSQQKEGGVPRGGIPLLPPLGRIFAHFLDGTRKWGLYGLSRYKEAEAY